MLIHILEERKKTLAKEKSTSGNDNIMKRLCNEATHAVKDVIAVTKGKWVKVQVEKIDLMKSHPKEVWMHVKILKDVLISHYETTNTMKFKDADGNLAKTDADNARIAGESFEQAFNRDSEVDWEHADKTTTKT